MANRKPYQGKKKLEEIEYNPEAFRAAEEERISKGNLKQDTRKYPTLYNECAKCEIRYPLVGNVDFDFCSDECVDERIRRTLNFGGDNE